jgi:hypothetical protein
MIGRHNSETLCARPLARLLHGVPPEGPFAYDFFNRHSNLVEIAATYSKRRALKFLPATQNVFLLFYLPAGSGARMARRESQTAPAQLETTRKLNRSQLSENKGRGFVQLERLSRVAHSWPSSPSGAPTSSHKSPPNPEGLGRDHDPSNRGSAIRDPPNALKT